MLSKERIHGPFPEPFMKRNTTVQQIGAPGIEPIPNLSCCYELVSNAAAGPRFQNLPFSLRHFCLAGYNEDGNVNLPVLKYSGKFHFSPFWNS